MRQDIPCLLNMPTCCEFMQVLYLFLDDYTAFRATSKKTEREKNSMVHFVRCHRSLLVYTGYQRMKRTFFDVAVTKFRHESKLNILYKSD